MATETQTPPEIRVLSRVASIPVVASSLNTIHNTLTNNAYTRQPADQFANKGLDVVESRYPYPFKTPPEDIYRDIKGQSNHARDVANKTLDEKVRSPALNVAQGIDQRFAPIVDYFEVAVQKLHGQTGAAEPPRSPETQFQYQRAFALSKDLSDQLRTYSAEQINQLRQQSVLVERAAATAGSISAAASSGVTAAQRQVHTLSDTMLAELHKIQAQTATLPTTLQASFHDISTHLSSSINDLTTILTSQDPMQEKVNKVRVTVQDRVHPLLEAATSRVQELLASIKTRNEQVPNGQANEHVNENAMGENGTAPIAANGDVRVAL
ncbi:lipid droplet-associated perilipin protein [Obba rivulosa]|uniref:Lipid droplet-associated perilipin protein n=1 Tax=Obba rivulosa TaxID=1052685 RepID=A0A8E2ATZ2_9APHY|nr:lipid droplet-associated perilipin protein [Obba rivulosa]